jgi:hypothetical protein
MVLPQTLVPRPWGCGPDSLHCQACVTVGYWPTHFKESTSVIIPKLGKRNYSTPKSFRPIVLLKTLGKLVEKMLACRLQFDGVAHDAFHPMQFGGVAQRSTEDAGIYLTSFVRGGLRAFRQALSLLT